jgi:hypothetical protein
MVSQAEWESYLIRDPERITEFALLGNPLAAPAVSAGRDASGIALRWMQTRAGSMRYHGGRR